jgi:hypothetical protein
MAVVIVGSLLTACALAYQGVYILCTGQTMLFVVKPIHPRAPSGLFQRLGYALVYLFPAVAIMVILATALTKTGVIPVQSWVIGHFGMLFWSLCFLVVGGLHLALPEKMLRWTIRANPELADKKSVVVITRFIGVGLLGMGIAMLARL